MKKESPQYIIKIDSIPRARNTNFIGGTGIEFIVDGEDVTVNNTGGGGGGGAVDSVNGETGDVVLDTADIADSTNKRYITDAQRTVLENTSGTNTGDQNLTPYFNKSVDDTDDITVGSTNKFATSAEKTKLGYISVTQAVDLDQMETDIAALANGMVYKGNWDASSGSFPGTGSAEIGWFYTVSIAGTVDGVAFAVGDRLIGVANNASTTTYASNWTKLDATDDVSSVFGRNGNVVAASGDYNAGQITNTPAGSIASTTVQDAINELDSEKQPIDSDLTAIAGLSPTNDDIIQRKAGAWVNRTIAQFKSDLSLSGTNTGDQDLSPYFNKSVDDTDDISVGATNKFATAAEKTKLGFITVTQNVDLDTLESDTTTNNAKVSNATHTGEVTGSTTLTVDKTAISNKGSVSAAADDTILIGDTSDSSNLKKATVQSILDLMSAGSGLTHPQVLARSFCGA